MFKDQAKLQELKKKYGDEQVFVVPATLMSNIELGFTKEKHDLKIYSKYDSMGRFIYRYDAEGDSTFQQIIPYVVLYNPKTKKYYTYERIQGSGEARLHNQFSLGFGGHIDSSDGYKEVVFKGMARELMEEVDCNHIAPAEFIGHIRNSADSNLTDHTGLAFFLLVDHAEVKETTKYSGRWMTADELEDNYFKFEDWGKKLIDYLVEHNYSFH